MRLYDFAFFPRERNWLEQLAKAAIPENWGQQHHFLDTYCKNNFEIAEEEGLVWRDQDGRFALWRVGTLTTADGAPIYIYFARNTIDNRQPFVYVTVLSGRNVAVRWRGNRGEPEVRVPIPDPPREPVYSLPEYQQGYQIEYNWEHFLVEHPRRLEERLPGLTNRPLYLCIFGAVELSHRLWRSTTVPQYFRGRYQWLLPLYITHNNQSVAPDLVATLEPVEDRSVYVVRTLLPPEWAYPNARSVATNVARLGSWLEE